MNIQQNHASFRSNLSLATGPKRLNCLEFLFPVSGCRRPLRAAGGQPVRFILDQKRIDDIERIDPLDMIASRSFSDGETSDSPSRLIDDFRRDDVVGTDNVDSKKRALPALPTVLDAVDDEMVAASFDQDALGAAIACGDLEHIAAARTRALVGSGVNPHPPHVRDLRGETRRSKMPPDEQAGDLAPPIDVENYDILATGVDRLIVGYHPDLYRVNDGRLEPVADAIVEQAGTLPAIMNFNFPVAVARTVDVEPRSPITFHLGMAAVADHRATHMMVAVDEGADPAEMAIHRANIVIGDTVVTGEAEPPPMQVGRRSGGLVSITVDRHAADVTVEQRL